MVNYTLQSLTAIIKKCCVVNNSSDPNNRYGFTIDMNKLEAILKQKTTKLHTMAFSKVLESRLPNLSDLQMISEYAKGQNEITDTFNGKSEVVSFMLFSTVSEEGDIDINIPDETAENGYRTLVATELFNMLNGSDINTDLAISIAESMPCYRIIVTRKYNYKEDRFEYKINIRSNYRMISYQRYNRSLVEEENKAVEE